MYLPSLSFLLLILLFAIAPSSSGEEDGQWCIADVQTPDEVLGGAMKWACEQGGANCSNIQENMPCYWPNTIKDHASYVFNNYYQKFKNQGASCYFGASAIITELDPSYNNCHYEYLP